MSFNEDLKQWQKKQQEKISRKVNYRRRHPHMSVKDNNTFFSKNLLPETEEEKFIIKRKFTIKENT